MTAKDNQIQALRQENEGLREELQEIVQATYACTFCKHFREPCLPDVDYVPEFDGQIPEVKQSCSPEWRGLRERVKKEVGG